MSNQFISAYAEMYAMQTEAVGTAIVATLINGATTYGTNVQALLSGVGQEDSYGPGSTMMPGDSYMLQIVGTDLSAKPDQGTQVTCNGSAAGLTLQVTGAKLVNGIWEISIGDINAQ